MLIFFRPCSRSSTTPLSWFVVAAQHQQVRRFVVVTVPNISNTSAGTAVRLPSIFASVQRTSARPVMTISSVSSVYLGINSLHVPPVQKRLRVKGPCPLRRPHPPAGEEFALGCGICRNISTF
ncbi:hypothetical protein COOONC_09762 [Cooperia oncophora]